MRPLAFAMLRAVALLSLLVLPPAATACGPSVPPGGLQGAVRSDGSSTLYPLAEAVAEEFQREMPGIRITVGRSGSGGGIARLCAGEIDIAHASRALTTGERTTCGEGGVEPVVLPVALDGVSMVTHPDATFVDCLSMAELRAIWEPGSTVRTWRDVRAEFPDRPLDLFGAGPGSGTFDTFTEAVMGRAGASRTDFQASEDDNVLVQGVAGDRGALGYFGYGYAVAHRERVKLLAVDGGAGCVEPTPSSIADGRYRPLSRTLFMVVAADALERPEVRAYLSWFAGHAEELVRETGYVALPHPDYVALAERVGA